MENVNFRRLPALCGLAVIFAFALSLAITVA